jgi:hypothetical protein
MNRIGLLILILLLTLVSNSAFAAGKPPKAVDIPITQEILDSANSIPYNIQSDGLGLYTHTLVNGKGRTVTGTNSVLMENVCGGLSNGDRLLETTSDPVRKVKVTLNQADAIQPGDPNYVTPALFFGTITSVARFMNKCTCGAGQSMYTMPANTQIYCPMHIRMTSGLDYRLEMGAAGEPETEFVKIFCHATDSSGCKEWSIDPISDPQHTTNPGKTRARLVDLNTNQNLGNYYVTFHLHVTRP